MVHNYLDYITLDASLKKPLGADGHCDVPLGVCLGPHVLQPALFLQEFLSDTAVLFRHIGRQVPQFDKGSPPLLVPSKDQHSKQCTPVSMI